MALTNLTYEDMKRLVRDYSLPRVLEALACIARDQKDAAHLQNLGPAVERSWRLAAERLEYLANRSDMPL